jgi:hypothetical protein
MQYKQLIWSYRFASGYTSESQWTHTAFDGIDGPQNSISFDQAIAMPYTVPDDHTIVIPFVVEHAETVWVFQVTETNNMISFIARFGSLIGISISIHSPLRSIFKSISSINPKFKTSTLTVRFFTVMFAILGVNAIGLFAVSKIFEREEILLLSQEGKFKDYFFLFCVAWLVLVLLVIPFLRLIRHADIALALLISFSLLLHVNVVLLLIENSIYLDPLLDNNIQILIAPAALFPNFMATLVCSIVWFKSLKKSSNELQRLVE